jgi:hypothetical protein
MYTDINDYFSDTDRRVYNRLSQILNETPLRSGNMEFLSSLANRLEAMQAQRWMIAKQNHKAARSRLF